MTIRKNRKSIGAAALTLAAISSLSMVAFAQGTKSVPMTKLIVSETTASIPATPLTAALTPENQTMAILTRTNESTGKLELSEDNGATWVEYDGRAFITTPAVAAVPAQEQ